MANLKNITDLPVAESAEGLNLIVNDNGAAKQIAASAVGAQADWNQNDENASDYVKNKPFWTSDPVDTELYNTIVTVEDGWFEDSCAFEIIAGQEYTVVFDNTTYVLTGIDDDENVAYIGSESIWYGDDYIETEPPFAIGAGWIGVVGTDGNHTIKVNSIIPNIHKIDKKYLPKTSVRLEDMLDNIGFNIEEIYDFVWGDEQEYIATILKNTEAFNNAKEQCSYSPIVIWDGQHILNALMNGDDAIFINGDFITSNGNQLAFFNLFFEICPNVDDASQLGIYVHKSVDKVAVVTE